MPLSSRVSDMDGLLDAIAALISLVWPEKVQAVAARIRRTDANKTATALLSAVGLRRPASWSSNLRQPGKTPGLALTY